MDRARLLLQHWLDTNTLGRDGRLPPERLLATEFGVTRAELRKALAILEAEDRLVRHVGRGTFLVRPTTPVPPPAERGQPPPTSTLADHATPRQAVEAALAVEPVLARLAAVNGSAVQMRAIGAAAAAVAASGTWSGYDEADAGFHRAIAEAAANPILLAVHDTIAGTRLEIAWGVLRERGAPPTPLHPTIAEHAAITAAIAARDQHAAFAAARHHLLVEENALLGSVP